MVIFEGGNFVVFKVTPMNTKIKPQKLIMYTHTRTCNNPQKFNQECQKTVKPRNFFPSKITYYTVLIIVCAHHFHISLFHFKQMIKDNAMESAEIIKVVKGANTFCLARGTYVCVFVNCTLTFTWYSSIRWLFSSSQVLLLLHWWHVYVLNVSCVG